MLKPVTPLHSGATSLFALAFVVFLRWLSKKDRRWFVAEIERELRLTGDAPEVVAMWRSVKALIDT